MRRFFLGATFLFKQNILECYIHEEQLNDDVRAEIPTTKIIGLLVVRQGSTERKAVYTTCTFALSYTFPLRFLILLFT